MVILGIAVVVTVALFLFLSKLEQKATVVVAASDLPAGAVLRDSDVQVRTLHASGVVPGAFTTVEEVQGRTLTVPRLAGEQFTPAAFQEQPSTSAELGPGERAIALKVTDAQGVLGLLQPGDTVSAVLVDGHTYRARLALTDLRVLRVSFDFRYQEPDTRPAAATTGPIALGGSSSTTPAASSTSSSNTNRKTEGVIVLAVPAAVQVSAWQFPYVDSEGETTIYTGTLKIAPAEALALLNQVGGVHLVLEPRTRQPQEATTGLALEWLFPTPQPTPAPPVGGPAPVVTPEPATPEPATPEPEPVATPEPVTP